jgi:hypothetical protein
VFWFKVKVARALSIVLVPTMIVTTALSIHAAITLTWYDNSMGMMLDPMLAKAGELEIK